MKLLLFDIDGTLLMSHGLSKRIFCEALSRMFDLPISWEGYRYQGQPDRKIAIDLLERVGLSVDRDDALIDEAFELMGALWAAERDARDQITVFDGVFDVIEHVIEREDLVPGIVTANSKVTAFAKLQAVGIDPAEFPVGAFGNEALKRNDLPPLAMQRASARLNRPLNGAQTVVIGDSPADIECARASGASVVAVSTGFYSRELLADHRPDYLIDRLDELLGLI